MNPATLRSKRVVLPTITVVAVLAGGGAAWSASASDNLGGGERDRVARAAVEAVGGTVTDVEAGDDPGEAYEVELRAEDGSEVDVALDQDLQVVSQETERSDDETGDDNGDDDGEDRGSRDADDRALRSSERASAEAAARSAVHGGTVLEVEAGDDGDGAYEVEVRDADGAEWDVELDADFTVTRKTVDD